ncbi:MAG: tagaturonate epimerase family protein [Candidatus Neomarinimicrobiota bacterium]
MSRDSKPAILGLKRSFGFGDRLGLATPGHIEAIKGKPFAGIFAQQSIRELQRTNRQPVDVMNAAVNAVVAEKWENSWGADADHLQNREDVFRMADSGYTFFTIDPSKYVNNNADSLSSDILKNIYDELTTQNKLESSDILERYLGESFQLIYSLKLAFNNQSNLLRAIIKYGVALKYTLKMYKWICEACQNRPFEVELSVDETDTPTTPLEHLFIGLELKRMGVNVISVAPRFIGAFEKGIDYKGNISKFENHFVQHAEIAKFCGPYKLSIHSGSDKFSIYPIIGRISGENLHVKTAGTSYLEALRVICLTDIALFREIATHSRIRFNKDKMSYHISAKLNHIPERINNDEMENWYLVNESGRQILHVTYGSVLVGGTDSKGHPLKDRIMNNLIKNEELYREFLQRHLGKHIDLLLSQINMSAH